MTNNIIFATSIKWFVTSILLNLGFGTMDQFKDSTDEVEKKEKLTEAISYFKTVVEVNPHDKDAYLLLGNGYFYLQNFEESIISYQNALKVDARFKDAKLNLALAYREYGKIVGQKDSDISKALELLSKAVELAPNDAVAMSYLGTAYGMSNQPQKLIDVLTKALAIRYDKQDAINISVAYRQLGKIKKAKKYEKMVRINQIEKI